MIWPFTGGQAEEDRSVIEISNDVGDHWVADIPTSGVQDAEKALRKAGLESDRDDYVSRRHDAEEILASRDSAQWRYRSEPVVDESEDLEDTYDRENDTSDYERSEQPAWRWW